MLSTDKDFSRLFLQKALEIYRVMQGNGKDYMKPSIARTEWKLAKVMKVRGSPLDADAALMETRSLSYLESTVDLKGKTPQDEDQIEEAFNNLLFFWSR